MRFLKVDKFFTFNIYDPIDVRLLTRLHLDFSQLNEHKLLHIFRDTVSPMFEFGSEIYSRKHFTLPIFCCPKKSSL